MNLLVTGGNGFVMSNFVRTRLERHPKSRAVILDSAAPDDLTEAFFAPVRGRIDWIEGDILQPRHWARELKGPIDAIVHGATLTPHPYVDDDGQPRDPERESPTRVLDVNIAGTTGLLEYAREQPELRRFIYISTGSVYSDHGPETSGLPLPEDGYAAPQTLYGISKYASEMIVRRYGELYGLPTASVRLSSVFGPMDRPNASRHVYGAPNLIVNLAMAGKPLRVHSFDGVGDWIHAADVALALSLLVNAAHVRHNVYNIAYGRVETMRDLIAHVAERIPLSASPADSSSANVRCDPDRRAGQWGAYDISRMHGEFGWSPAPLRQRVHEYIDWLQANPIKPQHQGDSHES
jgi:UDP-glucose 4-epimerase